MKTPQVIFIDRDGTLIIDKNYLSDPKGIEWYPDTFKALKIFQDLNIPLYVLTNQSGVGRGYFTMREVDAIHQQLQKDLKAVGLKPFDGFLVCPHAPFENCSCRKPKPELVVNKLGELKLDPQQTWVVGDKDIDAQTAKAIGGLGYIVRTTSEAGLTSFKDLLSLAQSLKD